MNDAEEPRVKELFCHLMNEEKEHVAEFTAALFRLTHEPLPEETGLTSAVSRPVLFSRKLISECRRDAPCKNRRVPAAFLRPGS